MDTILRNNQMLLLLIATAVAVVLIMSFLLLRQRMLNRQSQPQYGFLGKPLLGLFATGITLIGIAGGSYLLNQPQTTYKTEAGIQLSVSYEQKLLVSGTETNTYEFIATPKVDDAAYGLDGKTFDIYWNFKGPQTLAVSELYRSSTNQSKQVVTLKKGSYYLKILVIYQNETTILETNIVI